MYCCHFQDGTKVFTASCDKTAKMWDLNSNQAIQVAQVFLLSIHLDFLYGKKCVYYYFRILARCTRQNRSLDKSFQLHLLNDRKLG